MQSPLCHDRKSQEAGALLLAHPSTGLQPVSGLNYLVAIICSLFGPPKKVISGKINSLQPLSQNTWGGGGAMRARAIGFTTCTVFIALTGSACTKKPVEESLGQRLVAEDASSRVKALTAAKALPPEAR